jgi:hypothetical protein
MLVAYSRVKLLCSSRIVGQHRVLAMNGLGFKNAKRNPPYGILLGTEIVRASGGYAMLVTNKNTWFCNTRIRVTDPRLPFRVLILFERN